MLRLWAQSAALQAHQRAVADSWRFALIEETMRRLGRRDRNARLRATATVGAVFAALDAALSEWQARSPSSAVRRGDPNSLDDLFDEALSAVGGGLASSHKNVKELFEMRHTEGLALLERDARPRRWEFSRRGLRPHDVAVGITYCGVCASDLAAMNSVDASRLPLVLGREFTGTVSAVGADVTRFAVGDPVAAGNIVDSCGQCENCVAGYENYCVHFPTSTYLGSDRRDGTPTQGGWSTEWVVDEKWVYQLSDSLDPSAAAPLMCAGITAWEALTHWRSVPAAGSVS